MRWAEAAIHATSAAVEEHGATDLDVSGVVAAAVVGVVGREDVAITDGVAEAGHGRANDVHRRCPLVLDRAPADEHLAAGVEHVGGEVLAFGDDRAHRGLLDRQRALVGDRLEPGAEQLEQDGIRAHQPRSSMTSAPAGVSRAFRPAGTQIVVSGASTKAGPCTTMPSDSVSRRNTSTSTGPSPRWRNTDRMLTGTGGAPATPAARSPPARAGRRPSLGRDHAQGHEFDSDPSDQRTPAKAADVLIAEPGGAPVGIDGLGGVARQRDAELPALTLEPQVGLDRQRAVLWGDSVGDEIGASGLPHLGADRAEELAVDRHGRGQGTGPLPTKGSGGGAVGREHARQFRHGDTPRPDGGGDIGAEERPAPAVGDEREADGRQAAAREPGSYRLGCHGQRHGADAPGRLDRVETELGTEPLARQPRRVGVEHHPAAEEVARVEVAEHDQRVGDGRPRRHHGRSRRDRGRHRPIAGRRGARRPRRPKRSTLRRSRRSRRRPSTARSSARPADRGCAAAPRPG